MLIDIKLFDCNDLTSLFVQRMNLKSVFSSKVKFCFQEKKKEEEEMVNNESHVHDWKPYRIYVGTFVLL